jgi:hypothetical protein
MTWECIDSRHGLAKSRKGPRVCCYRMCALIIGRAVLYHSSGVPRQNDDQPLNQQLANRAVTLLKNEAQCSQSFGEAQACSMPPNSIRARRSASARGTPLRVKSSTYAQCGNAVPHPSRSPSESAAASPLSTNECASTTSYFLRPVSQYSRDKTRGHSYLSATMGSTCAARRAGI